jgi:hypothetical protein
MPRAVGLAPRWLTPLWLTPLWPIASWLAACGGPTATRPAPAPPIVTGQPTGGALEPLLEVLGRAGSLDAICFAWSPAKATAACAIESSSIQGGATVAVRLLGGAPGEYVLYRHPEDQQFFAIDPAGVGRAAVDAVAAELTSGGYQVWDFAPVAVAPGATATIAGWTLRRTRTATGTDGDPQTGTWDTYDDRLELGCGARWSPLAVAGDAFGHPVGEPEIHALVAGGQLVLTASVSWAIEGDNGAASEAVAIDAACPR